MPKRSTSSNGRRKNPHAVALGKLGASKGGKARARNTTPSERSKIARQGGKAGGKGRPKS
jgi:hypothetical protein